MKKPIISADSHITEPAGTYVDRIDHRYKDSAPHMVRDEKLGDVFIVKDFPRPVTIGLAAAAGIDAEKLRIFGAKFEDLHKGGWDTRGWPTRIATASPLRSSIRRSE